MVVCAGVVIRNPENHYLLVLGRKARKWGFPKGHIEPGEDLVGCAQREAFEETGLEIKIPNGSKSCSTKKSIYYLVDTTSITGGSIKIQDHNEIQDVKWFSLEQIQMFHRDYVNSDLWDFIRCSRWFR